jgi:hypothetical protein
MYAVRDAGDSFFEEENRMMMLNKAPYRRLLREVKAIGNELKTGTARTKTDAARTHAQ